MKGDITVPGDKSISHRAALIGAIAEGRTDLYNYSASTDCLSTLDCLRCLGVKIVGSGGGERLAIYGNGLTGLREPNNHLDAGNSGTTARLLTGILVGQDIFTVITGDRHLNDRPMKRITAPLKQMGALIDGRSKGSRLPLAVRGTKKLKAISYDLPVASAQVKSAILLAGLFTKGQTVVKETQKSRDHTERMLRYFGADLNITNDGGGHEQISIRGCKELTARELIIPGDISSASFFITGATIIPGSDLTVRKVGINPTRTGILDVLEQMGANISIFNEADNAGEPLADIRVKGSTLQGVTIEGDLVPRVIDEIPIIAVAASLAEGTTIVRDAVELRTKESDRIQAIVHELKKFGVDIEERQDGFIINGGNPLNGANCDSHNDHRMAMSLAIAGLIGEGKTSITNAGCINISFPGFADILKIFHENNT